MMEMKLTVDENIDGFFRNSNILFEKDLPKRPREIMMTKYHFHKSLLVVDKPTRTIFERGKKKLTGNKKFRINICVSQTTRKKQKLYETFM